MTEQFFDSGLLSAAGMTVLHSFWQASLLALVLWLYSRQSYSSAHPRYAIGCSLLVAQVVLAIITFFTYYDPVGTAAYGTFVVAADSIVTAGSSPPDAETAAWHTPDFWLNALVACWAISTAAGGARLAWSYRQVRRMALAAVPVEPDGSYAPFYEHARHLAHRIGYFGPLRIGLSEHINGPMLVGHLKPLLLFPVALVNELTTDEAETVLLHELAHLRRYDHLLHPVQCLVEVLFYYHPAIHWISERVREEREHCCDDLVLRYGPGRLPYARALLYFSQRAPATAALSLTDGGGLLGRVRRFIDHQEIKYTMNSKLLFLPLLAALTLVTTAAYVPAEITEDTCTSLYAPPLTPEAVVVAPDTLPRGTHQVTKISDGKTTRLRVEDGKITELQLKGQVIPPEEFDRHETTAERLLGVDAGPDRVWDRDSRELIVRRFGPAEREIMDRALAEARKIDPEHFKFQFEGLAEQMDSLRGQLAHVYRFGDGDGDAMIRLHEFDFDSLVPKHLLRIEPFRQQLRELDVQELDLQDIEERERELRDALRELEQRKKALSGEGKNDSWGGALREATDPVWNHGTERAIAEKKAAARQMREHYLAEGRRQRERARSESDCSRATAAAYPTFPRRVAPVRTTLTVVAHPG
ncbi:M56 family metallopeptidase [Lewinella sp. JB7]|uniref:M56 family metallopeptidase n=1 Tax=Lewinella sp. JB7 TaxID=2962887 RepID=UPI0020C99F05|nr:M56 family metallopeptidase [Lewinella sp. JB7]MCP9234804.1 hypothetical protein [Lewinella sp. JB7]